MPRIRLMLTIHLNEGGRTRTFAELVKDLGDDGLVPAPGMAIEDEVWGSQGRLMERVVLCPANHDRKLPGSYLIHLVPEVFNSREACSDRIQDFEYGRWRVDLLEPPT